MKLIIDIPDNVYAKVIEYYEHNEIVKAVYSYIYRDIPLDKMRAEIAEYKDDKVIHAEQNEMIDIVLEILDKYR